MDLKKDLINATLRSGSITPDFIRQKIKNYDLIHFAGHSDFDPKRPWESGWRLTCGILKGGDITKMVGPSAMPALVFSNTCQSGQNDKWDLRESFQEDIFGLANAFLLAGVKHFVGTFWEIMDEPSNRYASEFYKYFMSGMTMGEAIRESRNALIREFGEEHIACASYRLYGDPTFNYMEQIKAAEPREDPEPSPPRPPEKAQEQNLRSGLETMESSQGEEKNAQASLAYLIQGDVYFRRGDLETAEIAFKKALDATKGTGAQKAKAFIGLGRIASLRKQMGKALEYYRFAANADPGSGAGLVSQAVVLEGRGEYGKALDLFKQARKYGSKDQALAALENETRNKADLATNQGRQKRIDRMVQELVATMDSAPVPDAADEWTSSPLTLWVMDFKTRGYSLQEGGEKLLVSGIKDQLLQHSRVQLVERALLDKLLEELKLGTSKLVDKQAALSLGRILAAKLILIGQVVYSGPQTQISFRLIETETGRITAAVNETFGASVPASVLSQRLAGKLLGKLDEIYPLASRISEVEGKEVTLNIGRMAGTRKGQRFDVVGKDMRLEVISDQPKTSIARVVEGEGVLAKGMRVESSQGGSP